DWYINDDDRLNALSFTDFIAEVRNCWLPSDWAALTRQKMLSSMQGSRPFQEWAVEIQSQNAILRSTTSHLTEASVKYHLEAHMHPDLALDYRATEIAQELVLRKWVEKVRLLDDKRLREIAKQKEAVDAAFRAVNRTSDKRSTTGQAPKSGDNSKTPSNVKFVRLPALTAEERKLLQDNEGCFKCRRPFQKHTSRNCSNDFPDAKTYKTLTADTISAAKGKNRSNAVGALDIEVEQTIAVVMPSAALGDGTDSGDECVAPLLSSHLKWSCLLDGPSLTTPLTIDALIDHGSPVVLIDQQLVNRLGLRIRDLKKPLPVSVAMSGKKKQEFSLSQYVKLSCTSLDLRYRSRTVRAVIAPNLCSPLLLGGPFLEHNKIVIDHELRTCIAKDQNYDLLNPSPVTQQKPRALCEDLPKLYDFKKALEEKQHILEDFSKRNDAVKGEFSDRFPDDIPHNDSLPSDILFRVQPKDAEKIIQSRSYDCPKKYRDAWKI
ncbi:hypothetical protein PAXINDRAFT_53754, partial [Paxillus involutus ATCC 200175]